MMVPSLVRRKPCPTPLTSVKDPVTVPAGFMAVGIVDVEPGGSNVTNARAFVVLVPAWPGAVMREAPCLPRACKQAA